MKALRVETNLDKLKICYTQPAGLFQNLRDTFLQSGDTLAFVEYNLQLDHTVLNLDQEVIGMEVSVHYELDGINHRLGFYEFSISGKYRNFCFFTFDNSAFYTLYQIYYGEKQSVVGFIEYISEQIGLEFNNITLAEICLDTNRNLIASLRKYIKDYEGFEMFLNGNLVHDKDRKLDNYGEYYSRSRRKLNRQPTIYLGQKKRGGLSLRLYNKTSELKEASPEKEYISTWLDFGKQTIFRAELTIHNTDLQDFCDMIGYDKYALIQLLITPEWRNKLWAYSVKRILYFRSRIDGTEIELADML